MMHGKICLHYAFENIAWLKWTEQKWMLEIIMTEIPSQYSCTINKVIESNIGMHNNI